MKHMEKKPTERPTFADECHVTLPEYMIYDGGEHALKGAIFLSLRGSVDGMYGKIFTGTECIDLGDMETVYKLSRALKGYLRTYTRVFGDDNDFDFSEGE